MFQQDSASAHKTKLTQQLLVNSEKTYKKVETETGIPYNTVESIMKKHIP